MRYISLFMKDGTTFAIDECESIVLEQMRKHPCMWLNLKFAWEDSRMWICGTEIQGWWISTPEGREAHKEWTNELERSVKPPFE